MEPHKTDGIEPHWTEDAEKRDKAMRLLGWIFGALGVLQLLLGEWLYGAFLLAYALFVLMTKSVERLPKAVRYLLVGVFAAFATLIFVRIVAGLLAMR